jgi:hypothetical protein
VRSSKIWAELYNVSEQTARAIQLDATDSTCCHCGKPIACNHEAWRGCSLAGPNGGCTIEGPHDHEPSLAASAAPAGEKR